jgi:hypothetical protein
VMKQTIRRKSFVCGILTASVRLPTLTAYFRLDFRFDQSFVDEL